ncbi:MAG: hypothetical protein K1X70_17730 [Leptospirales bacterium]|nr:hypothetical protein [Leptospirales bacterium]HMU83577.1 hypothetical protein [Leptospiraceae bacterium]HMZ37620.1 hypothetical protein [Leptospiraceae bacterium]HNE24254.1 hypothetical protein [Leptospiraceae bacterium]HNL02484.1 hypothetical protein [Leptospiraceae bacterium]
MLKKRQIEQDLALKKLSVVLARYNKQEAARREAFELLKEETNLFEKKYREEFELDLFQTYDRYLERLEANAADAARKMEEMQPELAAERELVMIARRNTRIIEKLKEHYKKDYEKENQLLEKEELFELNSRIAGMEEQHGESGIIEERRKPPEEPDSEDEFPEDTAADLVSEYFRRLGLQDPRKKR